MTCFKIEPAKPHIGGIVHVAKEYVLNDELIAACRSKLEESGVLVFLHKQLSSAEQLAFTDQLGERGGFTLNIPGTGATEDTDVDKSRSTLRRDALCAALPRRQWPRHASHYDHRRGARQWLSCAR